MSGRSLIGIEALPADGDDEIRVLLTCDCGTSTDLTIKLEGPPGASAEGAYTCDGCNTSNWFTARFPPEEPA